MSEAERRLVYGDRHVLGSLADELHAARTTSGPDAVPDETADLASLLDERLAAADLATTRLQPGQLVQGGGLLRRHSASEAAELLLMAAPLLTSPQERPEPPTQAEAPLVLQLRLAGSHRRQLGLVLDPTRVAGEVTDSLAGPVHVVAVVRRVLGRRDRLTPDVFLPPALPAGLRAATEQRDLTELLLSVTRLVGCEVSRRDLLLTGPGALLSPLAVLRAADSA